VSGKCGEDDDAALNEW